MFMTRQELKEYTDYDKPSAQIRFLEERGIKFDIGAGKRPKVLKSAIEARLSDCAPQAKEPQLRLTG